LATAQAAFAGHRPELLLFDYHLGDGLTGVELRQQLGPDALTLPCVIITADHDPDIRAVVEGRGLPAALQATQAAGPESGDGAPGDGALGADLTPGDRARRNRWPDGSGRLESVVEDPAVIKLQRQVFQHGQIEGADAVAAAAIEHDTVHQFIDQGCRTLFGGFDAQRRIA
jgi:hypothetical protein